MRFASRLRANEFTLIQDSIHHPKISLLVPLYRQSQFVEVSLASILAQRGIPCEIIISDDNSGDETLVLALGLVKQYLKSGRQDHRIVLRRGVTRLRRDHVHLLAAMASTDIVAQFHGDDIFDDYRALFLHDSLASVSGSLIASTHVEISGEGFMVRSSRADWEGLRPISIDEVAKPRLWPDWMIGSSQCWNKAHFMKFERLCMRKYPYAHDRIMPFRANLLSGAFALSMPLYSKRQHFGMWSLADCPNDLRHQIFKVTLIYFSAISAMLNDLDAARALGLCDSHRLLKIQDILLAELVVVSSGMRCATGYLASRGLENQWL